MWVVFRPVPTGFLAAGCPLVLLPECIIVWVRDSFRWFSLPTRCASTANSQPSSPMYYQSILNDENPMEKNKGKIEHNKNHYCRQRRRLVFDIFVTHSFLNASRNHHVYVKWNVQHGTATTAVGVYTRSVSAEPDETVLHGKRKNWTVTRTLHRARKHTIAVNWIRI